MVQEDTVSVVQVSPMKVYWLEQNEADVPVYNDWLASSELLRLSGMRFAKRRADWRLGRWTAKNAVAAYLNLSDQIGRLTEIEIRPAPSGAPEVFLSNVRAPVTISLTHREGTAACAIANEGVLLGCDLEIVEPHGDAFIADYFTDEERALIARGDDKNFFSALLWSAKESTLKALQQGLRLDPRGVMVQPCEPQPGVGILTPGVAEERIWTRLEVRHESGRAFTGWWQRTAKLVRTVVSDPSSCPPLLLDRCPSAVGKDKATLHQESTAELPA